MFNVRPGWDLPGLHNFKPPEKVVPGFRVNADGSTRRATVPTARLVPDVGSSSFGFSDGTSAAVPASGGRREACPLVGRVGPHCVYQCSPSEWVYYPAPFSGICQPFIVPGIGTRPWGGL